MLSLIGYLILVSPVAPPDALACQPAIYQAVERAAKREEVWNKWESKWWGRADIVCIWRNRYQRARDLPHTWDLFAFQARGHSLVLCEQYEAIGRGWRDFAEEGLCLISVPEWREERRAMIAQVNHNISAYSELRWAMDERFGVVDRRESLAALRDKVGWEAYYGGWMPQVVPVWYYRRID
jgi:hypothetical protein